MPVRPRAGLVAFAGCVVNGQFRVDGIAVYTRIDGSGFRLVYPDKTLPNGRSVQVWFPISRAAGRAIEEAVSAKMHDIGRHVELTDEVTRVNDQQGGDHNEAYSAG